MRRCAPRARSDAARRWPAALVATVIFAAGCGRAPKVEVIRPRRGAIRESFTEPARTRLAKTWRVALPVAGRIGRIDLDPGDAVKRGQVLAEYDLLPLREAVAEAEAAVAELDAEIAVKDDDRLEQTVRVETLATIEAANEALKAADAQVAAERTRADHARRNLERLRKLPLGAGITEGELDAAQVAADTALIEAKKQVFYRAALKAMITAVNLGPGFVDKYLLRKRLERKTLLHRRRQAEARLARARHELSLAVVRSPINGVVLERYEQGDRVLPAGTPLLLLGDLSMLEVVADVLTQDALRLRPGAEVSLEPASGRPPIAGRVKRIEPAGFTKLSSLGVEQQRVRVLVSIEGDRGGLGVGYRVQARFFTGANPDAIIVPRFSVLQGPDRSFYVFKVVDGALVKQPVKVGLRGDLELEIVEGLSPEDLIVAKPDATLEPGMRVRPQRGGESR